MTSKAPPAPKPLAVGDKVVHVSGSKGKVLAVNGDHLHVAYSDEDGALYAPASEFAAS